MAITKVITIKGDTKQATKSFDKLGDSIVDTKNDIINLERQLLKLEKQLEKTNARDFKGRKRLNETINKTKQSIQEERLALKSLTVQRGSARAAARAQIKANKGLNQEYFKSKESLTDVNRLTAEFALKVKAVKNIFLGATQAVVKFAKAQKLAFTAGAIGIALLAFAAIAAFWSDIKDFVEGTSKALQKQIDLSQRVLDLTEGRLKTLQLEQKLLEAQGKNTEANIELQKIQLAQQLVDNALLIDKLEIQNEINNAKALELNFGQQIARFGRGGKGFDAVGTESKKELEARIEREKVLSDLRDKQLITGIKLTALLNPEAGKTDKDTTIDDDGREKIVGETIGEKFVQERKLQEGLKDIKDEFILKAFEDQRIKSDGIAAIIKEFSDIEEITRVEELEAERERALLELEELGANLQEKADIRKFFANKIADVEEEERRKKQELDQAVGDAKVEIADRTLGLIGEITKRGSVIGKGVAVAQATISGIEGVQNAFTTAAKSPITTLFPPYPFIQAGLAGAFSALQIQKILSTNPSKGGGSGIASSRGVPRASAPAFNLVAGSGTNQIAEGLANEPNPIRAFVVSSEVTTAQSLDRNIEENASFG